MASIGSSACMRRNPRVVHPHFHIEPLEPRLILSAGQLDPTFSDDGMATFTTTSGITITAYATVVQPDGKVVLGGVSSQNASVLARYKADGSPDTTFGPNGNGLIFITSYNGSSGSPRAIRELALQPDGRIVAGGDAVFGAFTCMAVTRFNSDGSRDLTFNGSGQFLLNNFEGSVADCTVRAMALQNDGKIVVAGYYFGEGGIFSDSNWDFAIFRLNPDGTADRSFAGDGSRAIGFGGNDYCYDIAIDYTGTSSTNVNFGRITMVGEYKNGSDSRFAIARLNSSGALDGTFDGDGLMTAKFISTYANSIATAVVFQPSGKAVIAGKVGPNASGNFDMGAIRLNQNGTADSSFGPSSGRIQIDFGGNDGAEDLILSQTGEVIVGGFTGSKMALALLKDNGQLDTAFGTGGKTTVTVGGSSAAFSLSLAPNGTFVASGGLGFATARLEDRRATVYIVAQDSVAYESGQDTGAWMLLRAESFPLPTDITINLAGTSATLDTIRFGSGDYYGISEFSFLRTYRIEAYASQAGPFPITPVDDTAPEPNEIVQINISPSTAYNIDPATKFARIFLFDNEHQVAGFVYNDVDGDGYRSAYDTGLSGWTVYVDKNNSGGLDAGDPTSTTDVAGGYYFAGLVQGTYTIRHVAQSGYRRTQPTSSSTYSVTIPDNWVPQDNRDFGYTQLVRVSGQVFRDTDGDGVKDVNETGFADVRVYSDTIGNNVYNVGEPYAMTDSLGNYVLNTAPGNIRILVTPPSGYKQTIPLGGGAQAFTGSNGGTVSGKNFGLQVITAPSALTSIYGNVFNDSDGDKIRDIDPAEVDLVEWSLWLDLDKDGVVDSSEPQTKTDAGGNYAFVNLTPGVSYRIRQIIQGSWSQTTNTPADIVLASKERRLVQFGNRQIAPLRINVGGTNYTDTFGDVWYADQGFSGTTSTFTAAKSIAGTDDDRLFYEFRTGSNFSFSRSVPSGNYKLKLLFIESGYVASGQRLFNVSAEGKQILTNFDLYATAGLHKAIVRSFDVNVSDGKIDLGFIGVKGNATVSAIQLVRSDRTVSRVNAGATTTYTDTFGDSWSTDSGFAGGSTQTTAYDVLGTADDPIYTSYRFGTSFTYSKGVSNGRYVLKLVFADPTSTAAGQRKFNVTAEGSTLLSSFDLYTAAGGSKRKVTRNFIVNVTDGTLNLSFAGLTGNAIVSGIELEPLA